MTQQEIGRLKVINQTIDKLITIREAAELLNLSERQVIRLKGGVLKEGPAFIIHKNRGRQPVHALSDDIQNKIIILKQSKYKEANFRHFQELLEKYEDIYLSYSSIYRILNKKGISSPKKKRKRKSHHTRKRKPQEGMLVQIDASPHCWIIGETPFSLHGAIDDATGKILALFFTKNECLEGYFQIMETMITNHGIPISIYCDRHTIFLSPKDHKLSIHEQLEGKKVNLTQFARAMNELGINIINARSPQGKGRIERLWETLQSRLPVEFKIQGINTLEAANIFLSQFIDDYNTRFAVEPEKPESSFRHFELLDLDTILCIKHERTIIEGNAFSYQGNYYQLLRNKKATSPLPKAKITVLNSSKNGIRAIYDNQIYETILFEKPPKKISASKSTTHTKISGITSPPFEHPWRNTSIEKPKLYYEEPDSEILAMLDELFSSTRAWA